MNWTSAFNRLFRIIDSNGENYFSGSRFIRLAKEIDDGIPDYIEFIDDRRIKNKSTSRRDFFRDILTSIDEEKRLSLYYLFIDQFVNPDERDLEQLKSVLSSETHPVPNASIPVEIRTSERLNEFLKKIDIAIDTQNFNRAVTLSYTCLEGIYTTYLNSEGEVITDSSLIPMAKQVKNHIISKTKESDCFPEQIINSIVTITNAIANSRNAFSESHFDGESTKWLAVYARDLTNSVGRLIINQI